jgi:hypothetical protein
MFLKLLKQKGINSAMLTERKMNDPTLQQLANRLVDSVLQYFESDDEEFRENFTKDCLKALEAARTAGETLPYDIDFGSVKFRKGVKLETFINAARRWYEGWKENASMEVGDHVIAAFKKSLGEFDNATGDDLTTVSLHRENAIVMGVPITEAQNDVIKVIGELVTEHPTPEIPEWLQNAMERNRRDIKNWKPWQRKAVGLDYETGKIDGMIEAAQICRHHEEICKGLPAMESYIPAHVQDAQAIKDRITEENEKQVQIAVMKLAAETGIPYEELFDQIKASQVFWCGCTGACRVTGKCPAYSAESVEEYGRKLK